MPVSSTEKNIVRSPAVSGKAFWFPIGFENMHRQVLELTFGSPSPFLLSLLAAGCEHGLLRIVGGKVMLNNLQSRCTVAGERLAKYTHLRCIDGTEVALPPSVMVTSEWKIEDNDDMMTAVAVCRTVRVNLMQLFPALLSKVSNESFMQNAFEHPSVAAEAKACTQWLGKLVRPVCAVSFTLVWKHAIFCRERILLQTVVFGGVESPRFNNCIAFMSRVV